MVCSDHNNLKYFLTKKTLSGRQARWVEGLGEFDFLIEYYTGKSNPADGPSCRPDHHKDGTVGKCDENEGEGDDSLLPTLQAKLRLASLTLSQSYTIGIALSIGAVMTRRNDGIAFERTVGQAEGEPEPCRAPGIVGCRQHVPRKTAILILSTETADSPLLESLYKTLLEL